MTMASNLRVWLIIPLLLIVVLLCPFADGKVIYVDDDAIGSNDGSSWENAFIYLQDALTTAQSAEVEKPLEIRVAQGTYKPNQGLFPIIPAGVGGRTNEPYPAKYPADLGNKASFNLINNVTIKGGYAGLWESDPNVRDIELYETILSGDLNGDDIDVNDPCDLRNEPTRHENSDRIVNATGIDATTVLDGFTIIGGFGPFGSGMGNHNGNPTLINCTFEGNTAYHDYGGGLLNSTGNPTLINCTFTKNYGELGGGMCNISSSPTLTGCAFTGNYAQYGAGLCNMKDIPKGNSSRDSNSTLIDCTFIDNIARFRGGGIYNGGSDSHLSNCTFSCNVSLGSGGGMYSRMSNLELSDCTFIENTGFSGGGMYSEDQCSLILMNCVFRANSAEWNGGGMCNEDANDIILTDCTFCDNSANPSGGGMYSRRSNQTLNNCIFSGNKAHGGPWPYTYPGKGGGLYAFGDARLINCTFTGNCAQQDRAISKYSFSVLRLSNCILWNGGNEISNSNPTTIVITYSDIQEGWEGEGNIDADPCFVDQGYWADANDPNIVVEPNDPNAVWIDGDYHLKSQAGRWDPANQSWVQDDVTSPCIDAGDPNNPIGHEPFPNGGIINMGAFGGTAEASKSPSGLHAKYGGGTGEPNNPFLIYTAEQMNTIGLHEEDWNKHFKLMADIDLGAYTGTDFNIIGYVNIVRIGRDSQVEGKPFAGVFDGNGHTISNFSYHSTDAGWIGLFKIVSRENAHIKNLGLIGPDINGEYAVGSLVGEISSGTVSGCYVEGGNVSGNGDVGGLVGNNGGVITNCTTSCSVSGNYIIGGLVGTNRDTITDCYSSAIVLGKGYVGGLVGSNWNGTITNCASSGSISGTGGYVGGLLGHNNYGTVTACRSSAGVSGTLHVGGLVGENEGTISNCFSAGNVTGTYDTGGLVGFNWGSLGSTITDCYSAGSVLGTMDTGGLVGSNNGDKETVKDCFWDIQTSEQSTSAGGTGKTASEMQIESTFTSAGWDFVGENKNGTEDIWSFYEGTNYPRLAWEQEPIEPVAPSPYGGGTGTAANPYLIYTAEQLNMIGLLQHDWGRHFKLMADIDLSGFTGTDFNIVGYAQSFEDRNAFTGIFDGNGKTISNFSHTSTDRNYVAIFAYIAGGDALIKNLGMIDPNINAGSVLSWRVASLVAINSGTISNCYVKGGTISGNEDVGGLVGDNFINGTITNCYSATYVSGNKDAGGLVGENSSGKIVHCYSTAGASGGQNLGGLVGYDSGEIINSFWDIETSGQTTSSGGTGKTTVEMQTANTFLDAGWDFVGETANGTEDIWWILEGWDYPRLAWEAE